MIVEDFTEWHGRFNLPLKHIKNDNKPYIHFPWENNSCGLDTTMTSWWIIYIKIMESNNYELVDIFKNEYQEIYNIFTNFYEGIIDNMEAKTQIRFIFNGITDVDYMNKDYVVCSIFQSHIEKFLYKKYNTVQNTTSIFHWEYSIELRCKCEQIQNLEGFRIDRHNCGQAPDIIYTSIQMIIDNLTSEGFAAMTCETCEHQYTSKTITHIQPHVITISMAQRTIHNKNNYNIQNLDKSIILNGIEYEISNAIYGNSNHFVCRYIYDENIYEADGMQKHELSNKDKDLFAAESKYISNNYAKDMNVTISRGRGFKELVDVYYIRKLY